MGKKIVEMNLHVKPKAYKIVIKGGYEDMVTPEELKELPNYFTEEEIELIEPI